MRNIFATVSLLMVLLTVGSANATDVVVTVENLRPAGGLFFTPVWAGFHDGSFDFFDVGGNASATLEAIAEGGDTAPLVADFAGNGVDGVIAPGTPFGPAGSAFASSASATFTLDSSSQRYLSFASMIIPSNDAFFGNDNGMAYQVFDANGDFTGPLTIDIMGSNVYDAGTELNDASGAAFSALEGDGTDEAMAIAMHGGLANFMNTGTANGEMITSTFMADTALARITVSQVPEPGSMTLAALGSLSLIGLARRRRR